MLRQNELHEQIEIMAYHGPFCKDIENDNGNIFWIRIVEKTVTV